MTCHSPNISGSSVNVTFDRPGVSTVHFEMDEVFKNRSFHSTHTDLSELLYVVDPELRSFDTPDKVRLFYRDENYLDIQV